MRVETLRVGLHPGPDPGTCVCAGGHLHSKATVQNLAGVALGKVRVTGKAFGAGDELLGTATDARPNERAEVDLEFLTITGSKIETVKRHELAVAEAPARVWSGSRSHEVVRFSARFASCPVHLS